MPREEETITQLKRQAKVKLDLSHRMALLLDRPPYRESGVEDKFPKTSHSG
jgi:hypothetical protein